MPSSATSSKLQRLLNPRSVALVGASESRSSFGGRTLANLLGFHGELLPVNPRYTSLGKRPCYPSLRDLPVRPDCVVLAVPRSSVEALVKEAGEIGAGGVIVFASGYAETSKVEDTEQQRRLQRIAFDSGMPLLGPNCLGVINTSLGLSATFVAVPKPEGLSSGVGIVSQSGAMGISLLQGTARGLHFTHMLTAGNSADTDVADLLEYLVSEPDCRAIACQFEGVRSVQKLLWVGELARQAGKPVIVHKLARGQRGAAAALSHTGSLAGTDAYYQAVFDRAGFVVVERFDDLLETALFFARAHEIEALGVGMLSGSGGAAIMAADCAERYGVEMPRFSEEAEAVIQAQLPEFGTIGNPCDMTAQAMNNLSVFPKCAKAVLRSPGIGMLIVSQNTAAAAMERIPRLADVVTEVRKPILIVWMSEWLQGPEARLAEMSSELTVFRSMDRCMAAIAALKKWRQQMTPQAPAMQVEPHSASRLIAELLRDAGTRTLTERASKKLLQLCGVPVTQHQLAESAAQAAAIATEIGFPVVLKVESPDILHKTEAGGVKLSLASVDDVVRAYDEILRSICTFAPKAKLHGVLVERMAPAGLELLVGGKVDPLFGPVITVGFGGVLVELLRDTVTTLCPVSRAQAQELIGRLRGHALLQGFRGSPAINIDGLAEIISSISQLLWEQQDAIEELEVNPLMCSGDDIVAVDALCIRSATPSDQGDPEHV